MNSIFKANDVRGKYPEEINEVIVKKIALALGGYFGKNAKLVVGRDARLSSPSLYRAILAGLRLEGGAKRKKLLNPRFPTLYPVGLITTPMLYFLVNELKADGGIMVTASHNPKEYNGLKVVKKGARPMGGKEILRIMNNEL